MKIALLADIHANLPAFEAVLQDAQKRGCQKIWNLGDCIGHGPFPGETLTLLKDKGVKNILGNYDEKVLDFKRRESRWRKEKDPDKFFSLQWTYQQLALRHKRYLKGLPRQITIKEEGFSFLLVHGSPQGISEALTEHTPDEKLLELAQGIDANVILCAHSHRYFDKQASRVRYINPGSVGRPFDGDCRASYVILDIQNNALRAEPIRLEYPIEDVLNRMKKSRFPKDLIESIRLGRSLDDLNQEKKNERQKGILEEVYRLAESCHYDKEHSHQVCRLALRLFDEFAPLHKLQDDERFLLQCACVLHDIGWVAGGKRHHKIARDIILRSTSLPITDQERMIIALVVRYHRRALPSKEHGHYNSLNPELQKTVNVLASFLRIADGLDSTHGSVVDEIRCMAKEDKIIIQLMAREDAGDEITESEKKAGLFKQFFKKDFVVERALGAS